MLAFYLCTFSIFFLFFSSPVDNPIRQNPYILVRMMFASGFIAPHIKATKVRTLFISIVRHPEFSIICIGSESCLWSIVGLPGSYAYYLTFRYIRQGSKGRTTAIVPQPRPDERLSRESRKLTVMMRRELVNHSMTYRNLSRFPPCHTKDLFPVKYLNASYE